MELPLVTTFPLMLTKWRGILNPFLANQSLNSVILSKVPLVSGSNTINHTLGRNLTGWRIVRIRASATVYDIQDNNSSPQLTLILHSSAPVTVDLEVF